MIRNVGKTDAWIRFIVGFAALWLAYAYNPWWLILSLIGIETAFSRNCLLYSLLKIDTCKGRCRKTPKGKIDPGAFARAFGIVAATAVLLISLGGMYGMYGRIIQIMRIYYLGYTLMIENIILAMIQAAIDGLFIGFIIAWLYNRFV
ncbi:DUF2892 domain-containing protein [Candidatus Woesearchaeota archaeon]|nr:DUF2892 domain-containing protein [Candidatus Woesearchaeota archaeon]